MWESWQRSSTQWWRKYVRNKRKLQRLRKTSRRWSKSWRRHRSTSIDCDIQRSYVNKGLRMLKSWSSFLLMKESVGKNNALRWTKKKNISLVMSWLQQQLWVIWDHSRASTERSWSGSGSSNAGRETSKSYQITHLSTLLVIKSRSETGTWTDCQVTPSLSTMPYSLRKQRDGLSWLIHKLKQIPGLSVCTRMVETMKSLLICSVKNLW